jgi:hypothetical protein
MHALTVSGPAVPNSLRRLLILGWIVSAPAFAQMVLISESRSVTVSYHGSGTGTTSSTGTFGLFEASAVGVPFGGGVMIAEQKSNITPSKITIEHYMYDYYGPGGFALSTFEVTFSLLQDTRLTMSGYCSNLSGFVSLESELSGEIPIVWHSGPGTPPGFEYRNSRF